MVEVMWLLLVGGAGLVGVDWLMPDTRVRGVGLLVFCCGALLAILMRIDACVGKAWAAGGRARERQLEFERSEQVELAAVRELAPRR
jgi:hypothetical protein